MDDYTFQKPAILTCPQCGSKIFVTKLLADGQKESRTCPECGLTITLERPALTTSNRPGPKETK